MIVNQFLKPKIIVILGQTASGKSELAVKIAKQFSAFGGGEIISADSRQVYKGLDIGSGKITKKEMRGIKHHLLDVASPKRVFTVAQYQELAKKAIQKIIKKGKMPIICGGTGLYIDALIYDYYLPEVAPQLKLRKELEKLSTEKLFEKLRKLDFHRAKSIDKNNRRRLIRALEIVLITGKKVGILRQIQSKKSSYDFLKIGIKKQPEKLKDLIKKRLLKRLKQGMIEEVKNLHKKKRISWQRLDDLGLEYRYISRYLRGILSKPRSRASSLRGRAEMIEMIEKESWQYAKRQMTWFKRDKNIHWIMETDEAIKLVKDFLFK